MSQNKQQMVTASEINRLLKSVAKEGDLQRRIEAISERFIGCRYVVNSLIGGIEVPEELVIRFDGFDCVTYMEMVLALALSETAAQFKENLIRIRYQNGDVAWQKRNHYTLDWWRNNEKLGWIEDLTKGRESVAKVRELNVVKGLPSRHVRFGVFPKKNLKRVVNRIQTGDFVCFGSTNKHLDVFHTGILIRRDDKILLRHASRTAKKVIDQELQDFLKNNRMSGFVLLRPIPDKILTLCRK